MNVNGLIHFCLASDSHMAMKANKPFLLSKSHRFSTCILLRMPGNKVNDRLISLALLLFLLLPLNLKAQPGLDNAINIRVNDPAVTVTLDNQSPKQGETVTVTLQNLPEGKVATVTAGRTFGDGDAGLTFSGGSSPETTYTFTMPNYQVYINVDVQSSSTVSSPLTIETPGVASGKVSVKVEVDGVTVNGSPGYQAEAGKEVTVTLQTPLAPKLTLTKTEAFAPDGSWRWTDLSGNAAVTTLTFIMPSTAVTVRFTIHEDTTPDPPVGPVDPPVEPDDPVDPDPDEPDIPVDPDDPATAVDPIALPGLHIRTSAGTLCLIADYPDQATIYTFGGRMVAALRLETGVERQQVLPRGAYILRYGNRSIKFTL